MISDVRWSRRNGRVGRSLSGQTNRPCASMQLRGGHGRDGRRNVFVALLQGMSGIDGCSLHFMRNKDARHLSSSNDISANFISSMKNAIAKAFAPSFAPSLA